MSWELIGNNRHAMAKPHGLRGLELVALRITQWSRAFAAACKKQALETGRAIRELFIKLGQAALDLIKWLRALCIRAVNWLWGAYYRFETSVLETTIDIALTIAALRLFLLFVFAAIVLVYFQYWLLLTAYILFLSIATLRFYQHADIDDNQWDAHKKRKTTLVGALRWPLRGVVTILSMVSVYALSQVQWPSTTFTERPQRTHQTLVGESENIWLRNNCNLPISVAINYSNERRVRYVEGWWNVRPGKTVNLGPTPKAPDMYLYAAMAGGEWFGKHRYSKRLPVVDEKFTVREGETVVGTNGRFVWFVPFPGPEISFTCKKNE